MLQINNETPLTHKEVETINRQPVILSEVVYQALRIFYCN